MKGTITLKEQEVEGELNFTGYPLFVGAQFKAMFEYEITDSMIDVIIGSLALIEERYKDKADYLQVFIYESRFGEKTKFWCIHDYTHIMFLLPEER